MTADATQTMAGMKQSDCLPDDSFALLESRDLSPELISNASMQSISIVAVINDRPWVSSDDYRIRLPRR